LHELLTRYTPPYREIRIAITIPTMATGLRDLEDLGGLNVLTGRG